MNGYLTVERALPVLATGLSLFFVGCASEVPTTDDADGAPAAATEQSLRRTGTGLCMANCQEDDYLCKFDCMRQQEEGGPTGGGGESCKPSCGSCQRDEESGGSFRLCIDAKCNSYERSCSGSRPRPTRPRD